MTRRGAGCNRSRRRARPFLYVSARPARRFHARRPAASLRDHRHRNVRHSRGDPAARCRPERRRAVREGGTPGRHVAREHVPRNRMRRPVAPVQLLVRAQPAVEPPLLPGQRDPELLRSRCAQARRRPRDPLRPGGLALRVGRRRLAARDERGAARPGRRGDRRDGRPAPSERARARGARLVPRRLFPQRPLGPLGAARRPADRRGRDGLDRGADRVGARPSRREAVALPAHRTVGAGPAEPRLRRGGAARVRTRSTRCARTCRSCSASRSRAP